MRKFRTLSMETEEEFNEDEWFVETIKNVPRPKNGKDYDYMQFDRFISKATQRKLIEIPIMPSYYLFEVKKKITGGTGDVLFAIHFYEENDSPDEIFNMIIQLFELKVSLGKHKDNNLEVFQMLKNMPEA